MTENSAVCCLNCGEEKRIVQGGCCAECMEMVLVRGVFV